MRRQYGVNDRNVVPFNLVKYSIFFQLIGERCCMYKEDLLVFRTLFTPGVPTVTGVSHLLLVFIISP